MSLLSLGTISAYDSTQLNTCVWLSGEDPACADRYSLAQTNTEDHSYYLGHHLSCEESTINNKIE